MTATLTVGEGTLAITAGDSGIATVANNANTVSFTGTLAQIDALLTGSSTGTIVYNNGSDTPSATATITLTVNDGGNNGTDPGLTGDGTSEQDSASQTINIEAINDAPTNAGSLPSNITVVEDVASNIDLSSVDFHDLDASGSDLTVTLSTATGGQLFASSSGGVVVGGTADSMTFTGTIAELNTYFDNASNIQYVHGTANTFGNNADSITVVINDNGNTGTGGGTDQSLGTINIDISAVNDAPVVATNTGTSVAEGGSVTITPAMLSEGDVDDNGAELTYSVTSGPTNGQLELTTGPGVAITSFTQDDINNNRLIFVHDGTQASVDSFDFSLADGGEDGAAPVSGTFNFTVNNVNDASVVSSIESTAISYNENQGAVSITSTVAIADVDDSHLETAVIQLTGNYVSGEDVLSFTDQLGISGSFDSISGTLTLTGTATIADYETAIRSVTYTNTSDNPSTLSRTFTITVNDGDTDSNSVNRNIDISNFNDDPFNAGSNPTTVTVTEDTASPVDLSALDISDLDDNGAAISVSLTTDTGGELYATTGGGVTVAGSGTDAVTLTGTITDINTFLNDPSNLQYLHPTTHLFGSAADTIYVHADDGGNTGAGGGGLVALATVTVDIDAVE